MQARKAKAKPLSTTTRRKRRPPEEIIDRLIEAAREEFESCGYSGATTAAIARRADVTEAQLFRYYESKAALFRDTIFTPLNQHFCDFQAKHVAAADKAPSYRDRTELYITELQQFIAEHSKMLMSLAVARTYASAGTAGVSELDGLHAYFDRGAAMMARRTDSNADTKLMVRVSFAAVLGCMIFKDWMFPPGMATDEEIRAAIIDFVIDGISANSDLGLKGKKTTAAKKRGAL